MSTKPTYDELAQTLSDAIMRRASVEADLYAIAAGQKPMPTTPDEFRGLARRLGVPTALAATTPAADPAPVAAGGPVRK